MDNFIENKNNAVTEKALTGLPLFINMSATTIPSARDTLRATILLLNILNTTA